MDKKLSDIISDPSIVIRQDQKVFELIAKWAKAPCPTESYKKYEN